MINKISTLVIFEVKRTVRALFILLIIPVSLLLIGILYQFFLVAVLTPSTDYSTYILITKLFKYLQQFIMAIYSIIIGSYLFYDRSVLFTVQISEKKYIPYIAKILAGMLINTLLSVYFILLYAIFCLLFLQISPDLSIIISLIGLTLFEISCFLSLTFVGFTIFYRLHLEIQVSFLIPVILLFIIPSFIYSGIAYGFFPDFLNSLTFQYNLTAISNYFLPSLDSIGLELQAVIPSIILCITSIISSFGGGFLLLKGFEYA